MSEMDLLKYLSRGGYGYYWLKGSGPNKTIWFNPQVPEVPAGNFHVYFGVNPCRHTKTEKERVVNEDIIGINCLYAEFDAKDFSNSKALASQHIDRLLMPPNVLIDSGGGFHAYWLLKETAMINSPLDLDQLKDIQARWVAYVGGDLGAKDLARVLRVPGTVNYKYNPPRKVTQLYAVYDLPYELDDLTRLLPATAEPAAAETRAPMQPPSSQAAGQHWLSKAIQTATEGNRNSTGFWLACQLRDSGLSQPEAETILLAYASQVRNGNHGSYKDIEALATIKSAYRAPAREAARSKTAPSQHPAAAAQPAPHPAAAAAAQPETDNKNFYITAPHDHYGHALCFIHKYPNKYLFVDQWGWLAYDGHYWHMEGAEPEVNRNIIETLKTRRIEAVKAEIEPLVKVTRANNTNISGTRDVLKNYVESFVGDFDNHPDLLNCANGVVNLRTGQLITHTPSQRFTYCVPTDYMPGTDYSYWINWLQETTTSPLDYIQTAAGYTITGHTWEEILFYLYGKPRSGKGTFTETLLTLLGQPLSTEADFQTFTADRTGDTQNFDLAQLKPCRFVAAAESHKNQALNPAKIKQLTGRNMVRCAFKHRDHFTYQPAFKIWLSSNYPVNLDVDDNAAWGRVKVLEFPHSHLGKEDKTLKVKMASPDNLKAVLCWMVEGAQRWYRLWDSGQGLATPQIVKDTTESQRGQQDLIRAFLAECTQPDPDDYCISKNLYSAYSQWCQDNGAPTKYINQFTQILDRKGFKPETRKILGKTTRVIMGLRII